MDFLTEGQRSPRVACRYRKCKASFSRKTDAYRHERQVHQPAKIFCKFLGCRFRGTVRAEVMRRHLKSKHRFEVESIFQLDNNNLEGGLPKVKIPRESSFPNHEIDSFYSWSSHLLPIVSTPHETHVVEQLLETYTGTGDELLLEKSNPLSRLEEINIEAIYYGHGMNNQQTINHYHIGGIQDTEIIASGSHYTPCQNRYSGLNEQHFGWQLGIWDEKVCHLSSWNTVIEDPTTSGRNPLSNFQTVHSAGCVDQGADNEKKLGRCT